MNPSSIRSRSWVSAASLGALALSLSLSACHTDPVLVEPCEGDAGETESQSPPNWPDEAFRSTRPTPKQIQSVIIPEISGFTLDNGMQVHLVQQKNLPTVYMLFEFDYGSVSDPRGKALSSICGDLMDESTKTKDKAAFAAAQADHAVDVWTRPGADSTSIGVRALTRELPAALDLAAEMILEPGLRESDLERIKSQGKNQIAQRKGSPGSVSSRVLPSLMWGSKHPYGQIETEASVDAVRLSDCKRWVSKLRPKGAHLWVVGQISEAELREQLGSRLSKWTGRAPEARVTPTPKPKAGTIFFVDVPDAAQSQISVGHLGPARDAEDYEATQMVAAILGGSFSSRLNMNLREDKGWAYGARGGFYYRRGGSYFSAGSSVRSDATAGALREIAAEITRMRTTDPTSEELSRERTGALLSLPAGFASATRTLFRFKNLAYYGLPLDWHTGHQERLRAIEIADVRAAAETHLQASDYVVLVVGDASVVLEEVEKIAEDKLFGDGGITFLDTDGKRVGRPERDPAPQ